MLDTSMENDATVLSNLFGLTLSLGEETACCVCCMLACRDAPEDAKARHLYDFTDPREMEVASRCCRVWLDEDTLDDTNVPVAERMLRCGVQLLPRSPYAKLLLSGYLMDVIGSYQTGYNVLKVRCCVIAYDARTFNHNSDTSTFESFYCLYE
jgi:hypothetical protein